MFGEIMILYASYLEKKARKIMKKVQKKRKDCFVNKYGLQELEDSKKKEMRFNPYEGTNLYLIDELVKERIISKDDKIVDIGCGTGIFILYLSYLGFERVIGVEYDNELYAICKNNISQFEYRQNQNGCVKVYNENALDFYYDTDCTCFYLFNTFYDKDTYIEWIKKIEKSVRDNPRNIKIIILYPTVASMGAIRTTKWLKEKRRVVCKAQYCSNCMHFIVYEGGEDIENFDDFYNK